MNEDNNEKKLDKQRQDALDRLLFKVRQIASNSGKTFTYDIRLNNIRGDEIIRLNDCASSRTDEDDVEDKRDKLVKALEENIKQFDDCYSVTGAVGPRQPKSKRVQIREIIGYDLIDSEDDDTPNYPPAPILPGEMQKRQPQQSSVMDTNYSQNVGEYFDMIGMILGGQNVQGLGSIDNKRTALAMQVQEYKMKNDMQLERLNGTVAERDKSIAELKAKLELLEKEHEKMKSENEKFKKYVENTRPKLKEYEKIKTKTGRMADVAGAVLGAIASNMVANSKYGALLGFGGEEPADEQATAEPSTEETETENILIEPKETENEI